MPVFVTVPVPVIAFATVSAVLRLNSSVALSVIAPPGSAPPSPTRSVPALTVVVPVDAVVPVISSTPAPVFTRSAATAAPVIAGTLKSDPDVLIVNVPAPFSPRLVVVSCVPVFVKTTPGCSVSAANCAATPIASITEAPDAVTGLVKLNAGPLASSRRVPPDSATVEPPTPPGTISNVPAGRVKVAGTLFPVPESSASVAPLAIVGTLPSVAGRVNSSRPPFTATAPLGSPPPVPTRSVPAFTAVVPVDAVVPVNSSKPIPPFTRFAPTAAPVIAGTLKSDPDVLIV